MEKPIITIRTKPSFFNLGTVFLLILSAFCLMVLYILLSQRSPGGEAGMFLDAMKVLVSIPLGMSVFVFLITLIIYYNKLSKWNNQNNDIEEYKKWLANPKDTDTEPPPPQINHTPEEWQEINRKAALYDEMNKK